MRLSPLTFVLAVVLSGLMATASRADAEHDRWQSFIGKTVGQWMLMTGMWPDNMYDDAKGRVFVLQWVRPLGVCNIQLHTHYNGQGKNADSWTIYKTVHIGGCGGI